MHTEQQTNILLVDDSPENLLAMAAILSSLNQNLIKANSGEEALAYLVREEFAVILFNIQIPGMDELKIAHQMRSYPKNQDTPIIFISNFNNKDMILKVYYGETLDYSLQPIVPQILISKVAYFIENFQKSAELKLKLEQLSNVNNILQKEIQERQKAQEVLQQQQNEFTALFAAISDATIFINLSGYVTQLNPAFSKLFGYNKSELIGQQSFRLYENVSDYDRYNNEQIFCLTNWQATNNYIVTYSRKNGQNFRGETIDSIVRNKQGDCLGLLRIIRDITDREENDEKIADLMRQKQLILNSAGEGIYGINQQGNTTFINPAAAKMLGYEPTEIIDKPINIILQNPQNANQNNDNINQSPIYKSLEDGTVHHINNAVFYRKNGSYFPVEYISTPIIEFGKTIGAVITFKDITERQAIEKMKNEFISIVSHELRTPLTSIYGALNLLSTGLLEPESPKGKRVIQIASENSERLVMLVNDILDLERLESGKMKFIKQQWLASDVMMAAVELVQNMANQTNIKLLVAPAAIPLEIDRDRIIQVLTNLLSNAIKFSPPNSTVWLNVQLQPPEVDSSPEKSPTVLFIIKDQGRGIPSDKIESIFERFQQVDASDSRKKGGTGLGLPICRSIVQQHGGKLWVESNLDRGSIFYFTLPQQAVEN